MLIVIAAIMYVVGVWTVAIMGLTAAYRLAGADGALIYLGILLFCKR